MTEFDYKIAKDLVRAREQVIELNEKLKIAESKLKKSISIDDFASCFDIFDDSVYIKNSMKPTIIDTVKSGSFKNDDNK